MDLKTADQLVRSFIRDVTGAVDKGLNENGIQYVELVDLALEICFVWLDKAARLSKEWPDWHVDNENGKLICFSRIYTFVKPPEAALLEELQKAATIANTGGGNVEYIEGLNGLYLVRSYTQSLPPDQLKQELTELMIASTEWLEILEDCIGRIRRIRP